MICEECKQEFGSTSLYTAHLCAPTEDRQRIAELEAKLRAWEETAEHYCAADTPISADGVRDYIAELEKQLHFAKTGEGCPHGCIRPSQCVECIQERA